MNVPMVFHIQFCLLLFCYLQVIEDIREVVRRPPGRFEAIPDDLTAQEIAEQAAAAAKGILL
jgi:hypothetical protein